jgi:hypothetical protein
LLHIARYYDDEPWKNKIKLKDMDAGIRIGRVLGAHALAVFDLMGADPALEGARVVLRWIKRKGKAAFTFRDCHYEHKNRFKRAAELDPIIEVLVERNYIRRRVQKVSHRPSRTYVVNPAVVGKTD